MLLNTLCCDSMCDLCLRLSFSILPYSPSLSISAQMGKHRTPTMSGAVRTEPQVGVSPLALSRTHTGSSAATRNALSSTHRTDVKLSRTKSERHSQRDSLATPPSPTTLAVTHRRAPPDSSSQLAPLSTPSFSHVQAITLVDSPSKTVGKVNHVRFTEPHRSSTDRRSTTKLASSSKDVSTALTAVNTPHAPRHTRLHVPHVHSNHQSSHSRTSDRRSARRRARSTLNHDGSTPASASTRRHTHRLPLSSSTRQLHVSSGGTPLLMKRTNMLHHDRHNIDFTAPSLPAPSSTPRCILPPNCEPPRYSPIEYTDYHHDYNDDDAPIEYEESDNEQHDRREAEAYELTARQLDIDPSALSIIANNQHGNIRIKGFELPRWHPHSGTTIEAWIERFHSILQLAGVPEENYLATLYLSIDDSTIEHELRNILPRDPDPRQYYRRTLAALITRSAPTDSELRQLRRRMSHVSPGADEHIDDYLRRFALAFRQSHSGTHIYTRDTMELLCNSLDADFLRHSINWRWTASAADYSLDANSFSTVHITSWDDLERRIRQYYEQRSPLDHEAGTLARIARNETVNAITTGHSTNPLIMAGRSLTNSTSTRLLPAHQTPETSAQLLRAYESHLRTDPSADPSSSSGDDTDADAASTSTSDSDSSQ